ncbi:MAG: hypothetical protein JO032_00080 [Alphaproteobacteria bacterium]|nr:hypothetical protein [Alphaproteobacteria bacterium]
MLARTVSRCGGRLPLSVAVAVALLVPMLAAAQTPSSPAAKQATAPTAAAVPTTAKAAAAQPPAAAAPTKSAAAATAPPAADGPASQTTGIAGTQNPAAAGSPAPASALANPPGAAAQAVAIPAGYGLCQCIGNFKNLQMSCPGSAEGCQAQCGNRYSFVPTAQCPANPH